MAGVQLRSVDPEFASHNTTALRRVLAGERTIGVCTGWMYVVSSGRNAWNGAWSSSADFIGPYSSDLASAKSLAERWRKQGTRWYIGRQPALCLRGTQHQLTIMRVYGDLSSDTPADLHAAPSSLLGLADALAPVASRWRKRFVSAPWDPDPITDRREVLESRSDGGGYPLRWITRDGGAFDATRLRALVERITSLIAA